MAESLWRFLKTLHIQLPCNPAIPLLVYIPKRMEKQVFKQKLVYACQSQRYRTGPTRLARSKPNAEILKFAAEKEFIHQAVKRGDGRTEGAGIATG